MKTYAFDIECFKNLFCATFVNVDDEEDIKVFTIGLNKADGQNLYNFLKNEMILVGYNSISYDAPILRYFMANNNSENLLKRIFDISNKLVNDGFRQDKDIRELRYPKNDSYNINTIDLMKILAFDKIGVSLKQVAINLKWHKIQDLPIYPNEIIHENQIGMILNYNLNDVLITKRLYEEIKPIRELRANLSKMYRVDLSSASDSKVANILLEKIYADELKVDIRKIRDLRTPRPKILLGDCIGKFVEFKTPLLNETMRRISSTYVYDYNNYKYSEKIYYGNCTFVLGIGGLHSEDTPGIFKSDENYLIQDMDVSSYYPNLIINNELYPSHLGPDFIKVLKRITNDRLEAKKSGDKVKADGLKITINSIFGKTGSYTFWLYDPKQFLSTTVTGQLGLLMLIESLYESGIEVISANTDGVVCRIKRSLLDKYYKVAEEWEGKTGLELEFTPYKKYIRRDVNSYITEKEDGGTKEKGIFLKEVDLKKGYRMPIVAKALHAYFINNIPVKETLDDCKDIMEFCISQKSASNFSIELHEGMKITNLQKTNRFYVSNKGGSMIKRDINSKRTTGLYVGNTVQVLNEYDINKPFEKYDVNLYFYEVEIKKIIDEIEPPQPALFDFSGIAGGTVSQNDFSKTVAYEEEEQSKTIGDLNKLGKNQLSKRLESIMNGGEIIDNISPRYIYIRDFDSRDMVASFYSLQKGIFRSIKIDKKAYRNTPISPGNLVYCESFSKGKDGHILTNYRITDKIEINENSLF